MEAKTPTAPTSVCFLLSAVFILAAALNMKENKYHTFFHCKTR